MIILLTVSAVLSKKTKNAGVAQLAEQLTCNQQVGGSIPLASSIKSLPNRGVEQLVARRAHNPKARGSSPLPATKKPISADVAQSAERILGKDKVTGSIPVISSIIKYHNMAA